MSDEAYILGVLEGDGFVDYGNKNPRLGLGVVDKNFALNCFRSLERIKLNPSLIRNHKTTSFSNPRLKKYGSYSIDLFIVRATCTEEVLRDLMNMKLKTRSEKIAYLKGIYDSEGSFSVKEYPNRTCYYLKITNSNQSLLLKVKQLLETLGVEMRFREYNYEYQTQRFLETQNFENIQRFFNLIGEKE